MHILKIIHGYPPRYNAGSEVYSQSICNELSKHHKVSVFTREANPYTPDFSIRHLKENDNLDFYFVNNPQSKDGFRHSEMDNNFSRLLNQLLPDVAHIGHLNHLSTGLVDVLKNHGIPIVFTLHDFWLMCPRGQFLTRSNGKANNFQVCEGQENGKCATQCYAVYFSGIESERQKDIDRWSEWVEVRMQETRSIISKVDLFIAPSSYLRERFIKDFSVQEDKIIYLDYGFPTEYLTASSQPSDRKTFTFGYIGTHIPAKGVNQLIEAFCKIDQPSSLKIFGRNDGQNTRALQKLAQAAGNRIEFAGEYINRNLANDVFSKVDCIVVPSIWAENSPLVIHEAQACKVPVITADFGGMKEYVQHQINGLLFEHRDVSSLKKQMEFAIENPRLMKQYGEKGYLYSSNGRVPDIQEHCQTLVNIYSRVSSQSKLWRITIDTNPEDCNLNCIMCEEHSPYSDFIPRLIQETGVKRRRMKFETVENIFEQARQLGIREIIPSTMGEPLLYKHFDRIYDLSAKHNIKINLTTNGTFPKKTVREWTQLIVPNTTDIKISWNGATKQTAEAVMSGIDFERAISNVREFIDYRDKYYVENGYYCRVTFQLTFMQNNMHELPEIIRLAASLGVDRVKGHHLWAHFDEIKNLSMKAAPQSISNWNMYVAMAHEAKKKYLKPNGQKVVLENIVPLQEYENLEVPVDYDCPFLGKELWISATGKISPCCAPDNLRISLGDFGNIETSTIDEIVCSPQYQDLVKNYKTKPLCKTCNMRKPI